MLRERAIPRGLASSRNAGILRTSERLALFLQEPLADGNGLTFGLWKLGPHA